MEEDVPVVVGGHLTPTAQGAALRELDKTDRFVHILCKISNRISLRDTALKGERHESDGRKRRMCSS